MESLKNLSIKKLKNILFEIYNYKSMEKKVKNIFEFINYTYNAFNAKVYIYQNENEKIYKNRIFLLYESERYFGNVRYYYDKPELYISYDGELSNIAQETFQYQNFYFNSFQKILKQINKKDYEKFVSDKDEIILGIQIPKNNFRITIITNKGYYLLSSNFKKLQILDITKEYGKYIDYDIKRIDYSRIHDNYLKETNFLIPHCLSLLENFLINFFENNEDYQYLKSFRFMRELRNNYE